MSIKSRFPLVIVFLFSAYGYATSADQPPPELKDPDPKVRLQAWRSFVNGNDEELKTKISQILPELPQGLRDSDPEVRLEIAKLTVGIGMIGRRQHKFLLSDNSGVIKALLEMIPDQDPKIRTSAIAAIGLGVEPTDELEERLLARYPQERDRDCRQTLIDALLMTSGKKWAPYGKREPTARVTQLIVKALDDPEESTRAIAARAIGWMKNPPPEALPKLAEGLDISKPFACQFYISAIGHYGPAARPYLSKLDELDGQLASMDGLDPKMFRQIVDSAIRKIRGIEQGQADDQAKIEK